MTEQIQAKRELGTWPNFDHACTNKLINRNNSRVSEVSDFKIVRGHDPLEKSREQLNLQQSDFGLDPPLQWRRYSFYGNTT